MFQTMFFKQEAGVKHTKVLNIIFGFCVLRASHRDGESLKVKVER
jgi:hypothetical protein